MVGYYDKGSKLVKQVSCRAFRPYGAPRPR
jgi:hypothetical protein